MGDADLQPGGVGAGLADRDPEQGCRGGDGHADLDDAGAEDVHRSCGAGLVEVGAGRGHGPLGVGASSGGDRPDRDAGHARRLGRVRVGPVRRLDRRAGVDESGYQHAGDSDDEAEQNGHRPALAIAESDVGPHRADHDRSRAGSSGLVAVSRTVREPGSPATPMSDRSTVHATATVTAAGAPGALLNPEVSTLTWTSAQCRFRSASALVALARAICWAAAAERASEASRAAMPATPLRRSPASAIRAPMTSIARTRIPTGKRMASSTDSEPRSFLHRRPNRAETGCVRRLMASPVW